MNVSFLLLSSLWCSCLSDKTGRNVVVLWIWGWGNEHHNAWRRQLSRDLARASSWEAGCHCCCIAGTRGMRSSLSVVSRVIRRRNADKGAEVKACWRRRPVGCLWALSARLDALPGRVVSGCCVALVSVVAGDDICVKVSTSCCECSVSVQDGNTFASVELLMPLHPATVEWRILHAPGMPGTFSPTSTWNETASKRSRHTSRHVHHAHDVMHVGIAD